MTWRPHGMAWGLGKLDDIDKDGQASMTWWRASKTLDGLITKAQDNDMKDEELKKDNGIPPNASIHNPLNSLLKEWEKQPKRVLMTSRPSKVQLIY